MTTVIFKRSSNGLISFEVNGHSGFANSGEDIVCSAISAISLSTVIGITEVLKINANYEVKDGFLNLSIENNSKEDIEDCQVLLETMILSLKRMELNYGEYINVKIEEV